MQNLIKLILNCLEGDFEILKGSEIEIKIIFLGCVCNLEI